MHILKLVLVASGLLFMIFAGGKSLSDSNRGDHGDDHQLSPSFYDETCPRVSSIVRRIVRRVQYKRHPRTISSLARLHFHDCFVNVLNSFHLILS